MTRLRITVDGRSFDVTVETLDQPEAPRPVAAPIAAPAPLAAPAPAAPAAAAPPGAVPSPLAGRVVTIHCQPGQRVEAGAELITLEAMKMNTFISAPSAGEIVSVNVAPGDAVEEGQVLVVMQ